MKTTFIGDVHGQFEGYRRIIRRFVEDTIAVGDIGIGFRDRYTHEYLTLNDEDYNPKDKFISGNHDYRAMCKKEKGYLGDYGVTPSGIFFVSGAFSIDAFNRTPGIDWWDDEQLSYQEMNAAIQLYGKTKPEIVVSHDCPRSFYPFMLEKLGKKGYPVFENFTANMLEAMFGIHKPKIWIFGHWHISVDEEIGKTRFICLNELQPITIEH